MDSLTKFTPFQSSEFISQEFVDFLIGQCPLGNSPIHGLKHWNSALKNGRKLAVETGANLKVVELFSVLHDARRENENDDPEHGHRAAALARECNGKWFDLNDVDMQDFDRLDLGRVGVEPDPKYLCTDIGKFFAKNI